MKIPMWKMSIWFKIKHSKLCIVLFSLHFILNFSSLMWTVSNVERIGTNTVWEVLRPWTGVLHDLHGPWSRTDTRVNYCLPNEPYPLRQRNVLGHLWWSIVTLSLVMKLYDFGCVFAWSVETQKIIYCRISSGKIYKEEHIIR